MTVSRKTTAKSATKATTAKAPDSNLTVTWEGNSLTFKVHDINKVVRLSSKGNGMVVCHQNKMESGHRVNLIITEPKK